MEDLGRNEVPKCLEKDRSRARIDGGVFEFLLAGLVVLRLRALRRNNPDLNLRFSLATNVDGANPFDDIVLYLQWMHNGLNRKLTYFVQLKHKENTEVPVSLNEIIGLTKHKKKDFYLRHYHDKFNAAVRKILHTPEKNLTPNKIFLRDCFRGDYRLVLLTTKNVYPKEIRSPSPLDFPFEELFLTGHGETFSMGESDEEFWNAINNGQNGPLQKEFFFHLRIFSAQNKATGLKPLMIEALKDALGGMHPRTDLLLDKYIAYLQKWWESSDGDCITHETMELEELLREVIHKEIQILSFQDILYNKLQSQLNEFCATYTVVPGISDNLRCSLIKTVLERSNPCEYTILTEETFKESSNFILEALCSSKFSKEIVFCVRSLNKWSRNIIQPLLSRKQNVRILSSLWDQSIINILVANNTSWNTWTERWTMDNLSYEEQEQLLSKRISFQGEEIILKALLDSWPSLRRGINGAALDALVTGKNLCLGDQLSPLDPHNIDRTIKKEEYPNKIISTGLEKFLTYVKGNFSKIRYEEKDETEDPDYRWQFVIRNGRFFVTGFPERLLNEMRSPNSFWEECDSYWMPLQKKKSLLNMKDLKNKIKWQVWTGCNKRWQEHYANYAYECWLRNEGGKIVCNYPKLSQLFRRRNAIPNLSYFENYEIVQNDISVLRLWDGVLFLASELGIGKTTFLVQMSHALKEKFPVEWVLLVRISHGTLIEEIPENVQIKDIISLLSRVAQSQETTHLATTHFIKDCLKKTGKISILLDGVDEVCPSHKRKSLRMLELLVRETRFKRLWVTARPVIEDDLARTLHIPPLRLQPFTPEQQRTYLLRQWSGERTGETVRQLEDRIDQLLEAVRNTTKRDGRTLCDVPLYMRMLAEGYKGDYAFPNVDFKPLMYVNITRIKIIKRFLEETRKVYWAKLDVPMFKIKDVGWDISSEKTFLHHHKACAVTLFFNENILGALNEVIMKEKMEIVKVLEKEKTGIIVKIVDGEPVFIHRIFAEYFAALWLSENYKLLPKTLEFLYHGSLEEVRYFFDAILSEGNPVHEAAGTDGIHPALTALSNTNENIEKKDKGGRRPLHLAAINGNAGAVRALLDKGAEMRVTDKVLGWTPFRYSWNRLIEIDEITSRWDNERVLPHLGVTELFLQRGMKPSVHISLMPVKKKILDIAIRNDSPCLVNILMNNNSVLLKYMQKTISQRKVLISRKSLRQLFMDQAAGYNSINVMKMLLRKGVDINGSDLNGNTPLHRAAVCKHADACEFLIKNGANVNQKNKLGETPLHKS